MVHKSYSSGSHHPFELNENKREQRIGLRLHFPGGHSTRRPHIGQNCPSRRSRRRCVARTIQEYLLRRPILSAGGAFLVRPPRRTAAGTPVSSSLARSPGGLRSQPPRYGIPEKSGLGRR